MTAASYQATARLAKFALIHKPTRDAYLLTLVQKKPTNNDKKRLIKELETLVLWGEEMEKEIRLMGAPPIDKGSDDDEKHAGEKH